MNRSVRRYLAALWIAVAAVAWPWGLLGDGKGRVLLREDFLSLDRWRPFYFEKIDRHTRYEVVWQGDGLVLRAQSIRSASALILKEPFNVYDYPMLRWRWKVDGVLPGGDASTREGDDYPIRIYVIFKYDPEKAGFWERIKYGSAKLIYGRYPPHSSLNYIWANRHHGKDVLVSPYTDRSRMIPLREGDEMAGRWLEEMVNVVEDYRRAFDSDPPATATLAIMSDSDNTGGKATSYIDYIEIFTEEAGRGKRR